ncbi:FdtA/QdtA family cupin domain-containing protein [Soonwooa sp.]|uniref:sugar 3,4-ketoisomerase n=1 Tax=Soonwooa sp. TaxID=1938592 RepID=UPI0028AE0D1D|nr:FdtA/QdtA family cupin domain-containing protein [Soonwooa sp.]
MNDIKLLQLPKIEDPRGNLSFFEYPNQLPFQVKRTYWIYDVPGGEIRGSHAFKNQNEIIIALSGSFDIVLHDGFEERKFSLNRSYYGLIVPKMTWRRIENFSTNSLAFIATDMVFEENEYIRDFDEFLILKQDEKNNDCL